MTIDDDTDHYVSTAGMTGEPALMPVRAKDMIGSGGEIVRNYAECGMAEQLRHDYGISENEAWLSLKCADLLIRPCEVLSRVANATILKVANNALGVLLQHRHMSVRGLA